MRLKERNFQEIEEKDDTQRGGEMRERIYIAGEEYVIGKNKEEKEEEDEEQD